MYHVGPEHFLLGILREEYAPGAVPILHNRGMHLASMRITAASLPFVPPDRGADEVKRIHAKHAVQRERPVV